MEKFTVLTGKAVPWLIPNIDTDVITPMKRVLLNMDELEKYSFEAYRFVDGDGDAGVLNMEFPLNMEKYRGARIMLTGENFGCGSSRETAAEAIRRCKIRCLIGNSFGGIFRKNCFQQGILPVILPKEAVEALAKEAEEGKELTVSLPDKTVRTEKGEMFHFEIEENRYEALLNGWDDVDLTLEKKDKIRSFFSGDAKRRTWLYHNRKMRKNKGDIVC